MKRSILFISSVGVITGHVYAAETDSQAVTNLPTISVKADKENSLKQEVGQASSATKGLMQLKDVPQIVNVVPKQILREQTVTSMQGALQNVAGLSFSVGDGQRDQVMIRGFSAITDNYVDGIRDDALYFRDMSNVERVEVLKGPASVLYGRGSAGGLVNKINKKPMDQSLREVSLIGSTTGQRRAEVDVNEKVAENVKVRLTGAVEDSDGYRDQAFLKRQAVAPSVQWDITDKTKLLLQADYLHDDRLADQGFPTDPITGKPVKTNPKTFYGALNGKEVGDVDTEISSQTISLDHEFNDQLKYHGAVRHYNYSLDRQYSVVSHQDSKKNKLPADQIQLSQSKRIRNEDGVYIQQELSTLFNTGFLKHNTLIGAEYSKQHKDELVWSKARQITNIFNPELENWAPLDTSIAAETNNSNTFETYGIYLQDLMTVTDQLKVLVGLRYDNLSQDRNNKVKSQILNRTDNTYSPRIGLVYQPLSNLSLYTSYNRSFQPLADSFVLYTNSADLSPTKSENVEVGAKWDVNDQLNVTLALFEMSQTNIQNQDPANPNQALLAGEQKTKGVELSLTGQLTDQLSVLAGYSYMDGKIEKSTVGFTGNHSALTPNNTANLWLKYQINDHWYAAVGGRGESSRFSAPDNKNVLPGYAVVNAALGYQSERYDVNLNLNNLFDRDYFVSGHSGANDSNMMGDPLNAQVALRYRF
ncbi:tonB-dependent siderophore receptor family protein [Acinetobacter sp. 25977_6]|uniref:TonB-dependent siderophore receptor n=1 Tax=Acinetobacter nosocomialis TaxID=106654 RepID=A0AB36LY49_ACINO|nr:MULTISPECIES: TonB-dependent siderophore receptor [Acinetobacter calcoaceticus/baumannii complex]KCZ29450.1 tonB-dependent siderophore receptor family protein [Acinetobacter baumannii 25977_9]EXB71101.1 tonB-dependent siderophore receptor family protein [Acinetobacter sp. 21871]EXR66120.1 tonB-dependent siderophore receptor family protein [Acinetobacter sp. 1424608]EXT38936.1 tonB-dependent siderophore receptor family protein [Acinetobacter sp. 25977_8]EXT46357.1 tonB-dependent siderophore 